jgi:hypothetical protein
MKCINCGSPGASRNTHLCFSCEQMMEEYEETVEDSISDSVFEDRFVKCSVCGNLIDTYSEPVYCVAVTGEECCGACRSYNRYKLHYLMEKL